MFAKLMRLALALALVTALDVAPGVGDAQPLPKKGFKGGFARNITTDQIVERLMSFDKNDDGKVVLEELPERMHHLLALGDVNKDGALDRDEAQKLATALASFIDLVGTDGPAGGGFFAGGAKGAKGGPKGALKGVLKGTADAQRTINELNLDAATWVKANRLVRAQLEKLRNFEDLTRRELTMQLKDVLTDDDYRTFKSAMDQPQGPGAQGAAKNADVSKGLQQLQKDVEGLQKNLAK